MKSVSLEDILSVENGSDADDMGHYMSVQRAINSGAWSFQGSVGRSMMDAIKSGRCMLGLAAARDYWGNVIPGRDDVQAGTKGSRDYVAKLRGEEWAAEMEAVE